MRIYAYDYVRTAVGPTVRDICERDIVLDALGRETSTNHSETLSPFVQSLWENIYSRHKEEINLTCTDVTVPQCLATAFQRKSPERIFGMG
jgi:hypothetical protein